MLLLGIYYVPSTLPAQRIQAVRGFIITVLIKLSLDSKFKDHYLSKPDCSAAFTVFSCPWDRLVYQADSQSLEL